MAPTPEKSAPKNEVKPSSLIEESSSQLGALCREFSTAEGHRKDELLRELVTSLTGNSLVMQRISARVLVRLGTPAADELRRMLRAEGDPMSLDPVARALGEVSKHLDDDDQERTLAALQPLFSHDSLDLVRAAAIGIRLLGSARSESILLEHIEHLSAPHRYALLSELGLSSRAQGRAPLLEALSRFGVSAAELPALFGAALGPYELARLLPQHRDVAKRFGHLDAGVAGQLHDDAVLSACTALLHGGLVCTSELVKAYLADREQLSTWISRKDALAWVLLSDDVRGSRTADPPLLGDSLPSKIDQALVFAALRELDAANLQTKRERSPFDSLALAPIPGRFFHISFDTYRACYQRSYEAEAEELLKGASENFKDANRAQIVLALARADSETRTFEWHEERSLLTADWLGRVRSEGRSPTPHSPPPLSNGNRAMLEIRGSREPSEESGILRPIPPSCKYAVLNWKRCDQLDGQIQVLERRPSWQELLPSARSLIRLQLYRAPGLDAEQLLRSRSAVERPNSILPTIGVEVQSVGIPPGLQYAWKGAFEFFGIPSKRRPEFEGVTEASFRPSRSYQTQLALMNGVRDLAFPNDKEVAVHVSVGADIGPHVRYLALPLLLLNRAPIERNRDQEAHRKGLANLLSKGLICRDEECEKLESIGTKTSVRTEIRIAPLGGQNFNDERFILQAVQFGIAAAVAANGPHTDGVSEQLRKIWQTFTDDVETLVEKSQLPLRPLFDGDWYEGAGDYQDLAFLGKLKILPRLLDLHDASRSSPARRSAAEDHARIALRKLVTLVELSLT